jgi:hypothetical protein
LIEVERPKKKALIFPSRQQAKRAKEMERAHMYVCMIATLLIERRERDRERKANL